VGFGQIAELLVEVKDGSLRGQLSTVAMDAASVSKERGHKNGHNQHFRVVFELLFAALSC